MTEEAAPEGVETFVSRPAKTRTSISIRPDFLKRAKEQGPSVSGVIDAALEVYFNKDSVDG